jgi:hypothetical protein
MSSIYISEENALYNPDNKPLAVSIYQKRYVDNDAHVSVMVMCIYHSLIPLIYAVVNR